MSEFTENTKENPGVITLPPFIYLAGLIAGIALDFLYPLSFIPSPLSHYIGWPLIALAIGLVNYGVKTMRAAGTHEDVRRPDTALVTGGPFRYSRNPLYISLTVTYCAIAILVRTLWPLLLLPIVMAFMHSGVILREERHLERVFGEDYLRYKARVRRWL
ncbi:MAG: methyltransferase family protein [Candidatus Zixiibacteriota bacterium]